MPILSKPTDDQKIPLEALGYMRARAKRRAYDLVMGEFKRSGLTRAQLARRLFGEEKRADRVSRMLAGPGNWTIKTLSDLLWAISGTEPAYGIDDPLAKPRRNFSGFNKYLADMETYSELPKANVEIEEKQEGDGANVGVKIDTKDADLRPYNSGFVLELS